MASLEARSPKAKKPAATSAQKGRKDAAQALLQAQNLALWKMAENHSVEEVLTALLSCIEEICGREMLASVLLLDDDKKHLRHCAAPSLPSEYNRAINGLTIGIDAGSCGTAAFTGKPVHARDIAKILAGHPSIVGWR